MCEDQDIKLPDEDSAFMKNCRSITEKEIKDLYEACSCLTFLHEFEIEINKTDKSLTDKQHLFREVASTIKESIFSEIKATFGETSELQRFTDKHL